MRRIDTLSRSRQYGFAGNLVRKVSKQWKAVIKSRQAKQTKKRLSPYYAPSQLLWWMSSRAFVCCSSVRSSIGQCVLSCSHCQTCQTCQTSPSLWLSTRSCDAVSILRPCNFDTVLYYRDFTSYSLRRDIEAKAANARPNTHNLGHIPLLSH